MEPSWSLICITDLQYEQPSANFVDDPKELEPEHTAFREDNLRNFQNIIGHGFEPWSFDLRTVAGDVATHGRDSEFQQFSKEVHSQLQSRVRKREALCLVRTASLG